MCFCKNKAAVALTTLLTAVVALDGIVAPSNIRAGQETNVTFHNANNDDDYRVYLAAALTGSNGPTCYLLNRTTLFHSVNVCIPADVGPAADYYSIAIADLSTGQGATYSNHFNLTGVSGVYSEYENHLGGSAFWAADELPCTAYACARRCAQASYPEDLTQTAAYDTMKSCMLECDGVTHAARPTAPSHAASTSPSVTSGSNSVTPTAENAIVATSSSSATQVQQKYMTGALAAAFAGLASLL